MSQLLPAGTVTLLLADAEGSSRLWETQPEQMTAAIARLQRTVSEVILEHDGVRPVEQGEGDSFVVAFARASNAVACALQLQRAPLAPIRLRIGVHTGEVQLRDESNYTGPTINRAARLRDLAHGGQTVLSGASADIVVDRSDDANPYLRSANLACQQTPRHYPNPSLGLTHAPRVTALLVCSFDGRRQKIQCRDS